MNGSKRVVGVQVVGVHWGSTIRVGILRIDVVINFRIVDVVIESLILGIINNTSLVKYTYSNIRLRLPQEALLLRRPSTAGASDGDLVFLLGRQNSYRCLGAQTSTEL